MFCRQTSWDSVICIWRLCPQFCHRAQCGMASADDCTWGLSSYAYRVCNFQVLQNLHYPTTKARIWPEMRSLVCVYFVFGIFVKCGNKNGTVSFAHGGQDSWVRLWHVIAIVVFGLLVCVMLSYGDLGSGQVGRTWSLTADPALRYAIGRC